MFEIKNLVIGTLIILKKYTIFNIPFNAEEEKDDLVLGVFTAPILGFLLGLILGILSLTKLFSPFILYSLIILAGYLVLTKAQSLINANKFISSDIINPSENRELYSQLFTTFSILIYFTLFSISSTKAVILMPMVGFCGLIISSGFTNDTNTTSIILNNTTPVHIMFAFVFSFAITAIIGYKYIISLALTYIALMGLIFVMQKKSKIFSPYKESFLIEASQLLFFIISLFIKF